MSRYTVFTEGGHANESLVSEGNGHISREAIIVAAGANLVPCTVLGKIVRGLATSAVKASGANTGNGLMTSVTPGAGARVGIHQLRIVAAAANAGQFQVIDPRGDVIGIGTVGVTFNAGGLSFTLADGATDFVVGDGFDITVASGSGKYAALNVAATDGSQTAAGILYGFARALAADADAVAYVRSCEHNAGEVVWPVGITDIQKTAAISQLAALNIILR